MATSNYIGNNGSGRIGVFDGDPAAAADRNNGIFFKDKAISFAEVIDGTSTVIAVGERSEWVRGATTNWQCKASNVFGHADNDSNALEWGPYTSWGAGYGINLPGHANNDWGLGGWT